MLTLRSKRPQLSRGQDAIPFSNGRHNYSGENQRGRRQLVHGMILLGLSLGLVVMFAHAQSLHQREILAKDVDAAVFHPSPDRSEPKKKCTVWIAPSSLKSVNGYGVFTTRDLAKGERILPSHDGVAITIEKYWKYRERYKSERKGWISLWNNYWWARGIPDHASYESPDDAVDFQIGFGALPNHHCTLKSLTYQYPSIPYDDSMVNRFSDPATGSFTYNKGREFIAKRPLKAGNELFLNYGYCDRASGPAWTKFTVMPEDIAQAVAILRKHLRGADPTLFDGRGELRLDESVNDIVLSLLPATKEELEELLLYSQTDAGLETAVAERSLTKRTPAWIRENGICMENLVPRESTIHGAGQGAFATFPLARGEIIAAAPLMQIINKNALNIYNDDGKRNGTQLLLNYCFGHHESSLLLCPNSNAVLINHCSERTVTCGPEGPNAAYRWSTGWDSSSGQWWKMSLEQIAKEDGLGLAFEIVALRDIKEGDEIFIDYGTDWEEAWSRHVATWKPPPSDPNFLTAKHANQIQGAIPKVFVSGDLRLSVQHSHLFTGCLYRATKDDNHPVYQSKQSWKNMTDDDIMSTFADSGSSYRYMWENGYGGHYDRSHWPCSVLKEQSDGRYIVRIHPSPLKDVETPWYKNSLPRILYNYPRDSIHFFVHPQASDQHLPGVFRHPIGIRDDLFPKQWRNSIGEASG